MINDIETTTTPEPSGREVPMPDTPQSTALQAYTEKLLSYFPEGWTYFMSICPPEALLSPPGETMTWLRIYPDRGTYRIQPNVGYGVQTIRAKQPTRAIARHITDEMYPMIHAQVMENRAEMAERAAIKHYCTEVLTDLSTACEHAATEVDTWSDPRLSITRPLPNDADPNARAWEARAYVHSGGMIALHMDDLTIDEARAVLRALSL